MQYREQVQQLDCGISVIQMFYKYFYKRWLSLASLKSNVNYGQNGINLLELTSLAQKYDMELESFEGDFKTLKKIKLDQPVITVIKNENYFHYVIIEQISKKYITYYDPLLGKVKKKDKEFEELYLNIIVTCKKLKKVSKLSKENKIDLFSFGFIKESIFLSIASIVIVSLSFVGTFYFKILVDQIIPLQLRTEILTVSIFFILLALTKFFLSLLKNWFLQKIEIKQNIFYLTAIIEKIKSVKWMKINQYDESMFLKNLEFASRIASFKTNYLFTSISQGFCLVFSTAILIWLDFNIFLVSVFSASITIVITILFQNKFKKIEKENIKNSILFQKSFLNIIASVPEYKTSSISKYLDENLYKRLEKNVNIQVKSKKNDYFYQIISQIIKLGSPFVIIILSIYKIWKSELSIGELLLFMSIFNFFIDPLETFTAMLISVPITREYQNNLNAFLNLENENKNTQGQILNKINSIKIEKLNFAFELGKPVLKIPALLIDDKTHLIGQNGAGKSTLLKIISTLINTDKISFNERLIDYYNLDRLREQICYLSNNEYIPFSTVYQFLTRNKQEYTNILLKNIDKYNLLDLFEKMNISLHQPLEEYGKNISSGQKQFIILMRILSSNPSLILLDEAFENLDKQMVELLFPILQEELKDKIVVEISHRNTYLFEGKEVNCNEYK